VNADSADRRLYGWGHSERSLALAAATSPSSTRSGTSDTTVKRRARPARDPSRSRAARRSSSTARALSSATDAGRSLDGSHDPPPGCRYLASPWLAGELAQPFCFAQIGKPGKRRKEMRSAFVVRSARARRSRGSRGPPARSPRSTSAAGRAGGFADPSGWKCSARYCAHHARCPGGGGLQATRGRRALRGLRGAPRAQLRSRRCGRTCRGRARHGGSRPSVGRDPQHALSSSDQEALNGARHVPAVLCAQTRSRQGRAQSGFSARPECSAPSPPTSS
jgi:hypothetical protein